MAFDHPSLPWILLVLSLVIPRNKDLFKSLLAKQATPWTLLGISWVYFAVSPQDPVSWLWNRLHRMIGGKSSRFYTATFTGKTVARSNRKIVGQRAIERVPAEGESSSAATLVDSKKALLSEMDISELLLELQDSVASNKAESLHRFGSQLQLAKAMLDRVFPLKDGWNTVKENDGILISNLPIGGLELPWIRGDGSIAGTFTVSEVLSVIQNAFARKIWDARFDQSTILEHLDNSSFLIHSVQKGTFPVAPRDFLTATNSSFHDDGFKRIDYVATSVKDAAGPAPDSLGRVRAEILLAGWRLEADTGGVKASYVVHVDVKGSVPSAIIKTIQTQTPMCIKKIESFLHELGPLPFLLLAGPLAPHPKIKFTKRDSTDSSVSIAYTVQPEAYVIESDGKVSAMDAKNAAITVALPARTFGSGASITCKGLNAVFTGAIIETKLVSDATSFVVQIWPAVCVPEAIDVSLEIVPSSDDVVQLNSTILSPP